MPLPLIGITSYSEPEVSWGAWTLPAALIPTMYVEAIQRAGGRPLLVPPSEDGIDETLDALDGLVFSGGSDLGPQRDAGELALLTAALERDMPVLAVCRGSQVLNVALGGDLVQHLPEVVGDDKHKVVPGVFAEHDVEVRPDS